MEYLDLDADVSVEIGYLLPRPRCRPTPKCQTEIDYAGGCVPLEDYQDYVGESDATDAD